MNPTLHDQILTLRKYQAWRTGEDTRTMDEAGVVPAAITTALNAVLDFAEHHLRDALAMDAAAIRNAALAEAASVISDHKREGRQWVPGSLWGTITDEAVSRINALAEGHVIRVRYIEGVGVAAVMEPKK